MVDNDTGTGSQLLLEQKKNAHLLRLLSDLRSSETIESSPIKTSSNECQSNDQLERTYKKALSDFSAVCEKLEYQTNHCRKQSTELRTRLREKEDKADNTTQTLRKYIEEIAQQSSYNNNKTFDMDHFQNLIQKSQSLDQDVEKERLKNTTLKVEISQLEQKIQKKNELAGGISEIEYHQLAGDIKKSDAKLKHFEVELQRNKSSKRHMLIVESKLQDEIQKYKEKLEADEVKFQEIDADIEKKRNQLSRLEGVAKETKKKIGYDAADIGAYLKTRVINNDFISSEDEVSRLQERLYELTTLHATLVN